MVTRCWRRALAVAVVAFGASACGPDARTTAPPTPAESDVVRPAPQSSPASTGRPSVTTTASATTDSAAISTITSPTPAVRFVLDRDTPDLGETATMWMLPAGTPPDLNRVARIAEELRVTGDVRTLPDDEGGGWMVGSPDYSGAILMVGTDPASTWSFSSDPSRGGPLLGCEAGATAVRSHPVSSDPCRAPDPSETIDIRRTLHLVDRLWTNLGYSPSLYEFGSTSDEWSTYVDGYLLLDGHRSSLALSAIVTRNGTLDRASGTLATPQSAGELNLIGVEAGIELLTRVQGFGVGNHGPVDPSVGTVHLTDVRLDLANVWAADGALWLVPAYTFTGAESQTFTVIAVDEKDLDMSGLDTSTSGTAVG